MRVLGSDGDAGGVTVPPASAFTQVCVSMGVLLSGVRPAARQVTILRLPRQLAPLP